jgi:N-methylhydantoinase B/oxoprolinase/acetone carboxylase alpha subunit
MTTLAERQTFDPLTLEILWNRLVTTADEMAAILVRTSFSTVVGAANDFGCEIMDARGRSLSHATRSMPVFNRTLPNVTRAFVDKIGLDNMRPGDVFITNDSWLAAGHGYDIAVVTPFFRGGEVVGFTGSIANVSDIGGVLNDNLAREAYEEGLFIPMAYLFQAGQPNELVLDFLRWNVRVPDMVIGDVYAEAAANDVGARKILDLLDEYGLEDLDALAGEIQGRTDAAMRRAIAAVPPGEYSYAVEFDEIDVLTIAVKVVFDGQKVTVDFAGTSPQQPMGGINCTFSYTQGQTSYAMKYLLIPDVPENEGCYGPIEIVAPKDSLLNCAFPASVRTRTRSGWYIHSALAGALAPVLPDRVMAPNGLMGGIAAYGAAPDGRSYYAHFFDGGGMGAGRHNDGSGALIFPSSASNVPVEMFEVAAPILIREKEFLTDSGGAGRHRGGPGQRISFSRLPGWPNPVTTSYWAHRMRVPPFGLLGGGPAAPSRVLIDGKELSRDEFLRKTEGFPLADDDTVCTTDIAGGGGFGPPRERPPEQVLEDVRNGLVSPEAAAQTYAIVLDPDTLAIRAPETTTRRAEADHDNLDAPMPDEVEYDDDEISEAEWLRAAARHPADMLDNPEEDVYTLADGKPYAPQPSD